MRIKAINLADLDEAVQYVYDISCHKENSSYGCPRTFIELYNHFKKIVNHPNDQVIVARKGGQICGVVAIIVEPQYKYIECIGGPFCKVEYLHIAYSLYHYLRTSYASFHMDFVYPTSNLKALSFMKKIKAASYPIQLEMTIDYNKDRVFHKHHFVHRMKKEEVAGFVAIHNDANVYWTSKRLLLNKDKFHIYVACDKKEVIGYLVISINNPQHKEVYDLFVKEEYRRKGYATKLMDACLTSDLTENTKIYLQVDAKKEENIKLYKKMGFEEKEYYQTFGVDF